MLFLRRINTRLQQIEDMVLIGIFLLLVAFSFSQIVMRNLFDGGFVWLDGAGRVLVLWLALWGASVAGRQGRHIRIELLETVVPDQVRIMMQAICNMACSVISALVAWHSALFVWDERSYGDMAFGEVPLWLCEAIIPLTFLLLALRFFCRALENALCFFSGMPEELPNGGDH